ncbi:hypothetical protein ABC081_009560 [Providencia rettgeri]
MRICLTILFTFIFCILVLLPVFFSIKNRWSENKKNEKIEIESPIEKRHLFLLDERSLQSQPMFWTAIALPLIVGAILWASIAYQYEWELSVSAYSSLIKNAQFPFLILALSPVFGAFVMYAHRSIQTFTQINATSTQIGTALNQLATATKQLNEAKNKNKIDLYYAERKHRFDLLEKISNIHGEKIARPISLYMNAFFTSSEYNEMRKEFFYVEIDNIFLKLNDAINNVIDLEYEDIFSESIFNEITKVLESFYSYQVFTKIDKLINELNDFLCMEVKVNNKILRIYINSLGKIKHSMLGGIELSENEVNIIIIDMLTSLKNEVKNAIDIACDIGLIFSNGESEKSLFSNFSLIDTAYSNLSIKINKIRNSFIYNGDKLAAENQNPPE